jgi:Flp pilus assembly protein TadD
VESVEHPADLFALGNELFESGQTQAAIEAFQRRLALTPDHAATAYNLGNALRRAGKPVEAVDAFLCCLRLVPDFGPAYVNIADTLRHLGLLEQARLMADFGVQHAPNLPEAKLCLANVLHDNAEYEAAAALYAEVLARIPSHAGALSNLGNTLRALGRLQEALAAHGRAVAAAPEEGHFRFERAMTRLAAGDFERGWDEFEWRSQDPETRPRGFGEPWRGEAIAGRTILLHAEQGLGDTLQFVRYAPMVAARGCRVVLEVQPVLVRLLRALPGVTEIVARGDPLPPFDVHCPLLSLPRAFATRLETIPAGVPYLHPDPAAVASWQEKLPDRGRARIGLVWSGSPHNDSAGAQKVDRRRSIPLAAFTPLGDHPGVDLIALQQHHPDHSWTALPGPPLIDLMADVTDFADTAALVANLDLVIAVDTSVAHLAGGLGKPVWLLSRYDGCWRWLHGRDDSPWYPTMRIYRQERPNDWSSVIARIRHDLGAPVVADADPRVSCNRTQPRKHLRIPALHGAA